WMQDQQISSGCSPTTSSSLARGTFSFASHPMRTKPSWASGEDNMHATVKFNGLAAAQPSGSRAIEQDTQPSRAEAEMAVRTLIRWAGDDPGREGLLDTPARVVRAYEQWFAGYSQDPSQHLARTFEEVSGYDEMVILRDIAFVSHCEHHMAPIMGRAHIGYLPRTRVVGISKLARLVEVYARRLQIQEA